jgi:transposase
LARIALGCNDTRRLTTDPGIDVTLALSITATIGDFDRFPSPHKLVGYRGLNPRIKPSGGQPGSHARITKQGRAHARGMPSEPAAAIKGLRFPGNTSTVCEGRSPTSRLLLVDQATTGLRLSGTGFG